MSYGVIKVDTVTFTNNSVDQTISVSGIIASISGNLTVTGTVSGTTVQGTYGSFTSLTGVTTSGTNANFQTITGATGVFTTSISGATGTFTSLTGITATFTSGIIASGTAALPSLAVLSDPNTGIFSPGADQLAISTNGTQRATIDSSGRLLVGTSTARSWSSVTSQFQLEGTNYDAASISQIVNSNDTVGALFALNKSRGASNGSHTVVQNADQIGAIYFNGADGSVLRQAARIEAFVDGPPGASDMPGRLVFCTTPDGSISPTERMRITNAGLVGLGTSSPGALLEAMVSRTSGTNKTALILNDNVTGLQTSGFGTRIEGRSNSNAAISAIGFEAFGGTNNDTGISFYTQSTSGALTRQMIIDSIGRVGIGTASPSSLLHLVSSGQPKITVADDGGRTLQIHAPDSSGNPGFIGTTTNHDLLIQAGITAPGLNVMRFNTAGAERVRITDTGAVGIGTTTVSSKLHVAGGGSGSRGALRFSDDGGTNYWEIGRDNTSTGDFTFNLNSSEKTRIDISGRLLVGTSDGSGGVSKLVVQGASNGSAVGVAQISYNGLSSAVLAANTDIGYLRFTDQGSNSGVFAQITASTDATTGSGDYPGRLVFSTTADGAATPTERMRITSTGQVRLAGAGITFNGDTAAANELDDYEEGTWTPSLGGNTTYNYQQGNYTKIGRFVYIRGALSVATLGTGSTTDITGLPFSTGSITGRFGGNVHYFDTTAVNVLNLTVYLNVNTVSFSNISTAGTGTTDSPAIFGNTAAVQFTVCYQV